MRELRIEVYYPPYYWGTRPTIISAPTILDRGSTFDIGTEEAQDIKRVALIRCGSVTHSFNPDQRYVGLAIQSRTSKNLTVVSPPNNNIAPPGYYMMFIVNKLGVPSVGRFIRIGIMRKIRKVRNSKNS